MAIELPSIKMIHHGMLIKLRYCQAKKMVYEMGNYALFLMMAFLLIVGFTYFVHRDESGSNKLIALLGVIVIFIHQARKDKDFVFKHIAYPHLEMMLEYLVFILPFILFGFYFFRFQAIVLLLLIISIVPYINIVARQNKFNAFIKYIPASMFEWRSGVRKTFMPLVFLYVVALASSWFNYLPLVILWLITTIMMSFYDENESMIILHEYETNAHRFLYKKIKEHGQFFLMLYLPILAVNTICNPSYLLINCLFALAQIALLVFAITTKYKHYIPNVKLFNNSNFTAIMTLLAALPGFFIIPLFLAIFNYRLAINNLKPYFDND